MRLNLEPKTKEQELVKAYLEENASEILAKKSTTVRLLKRRKDSYQQKDAGRIYEIRFKRGKETCLKRCKFSVCRR